MTANSYRGFTGTERARAFRWLKKEIAAGRRQLPTRCDTCGQTRGLIQLHSEDYSAPYGDHIGAWGLCWRCHMMVHNRHKAPDAWERYRAALVAGVHFEPFPHPNWWGFVAQHLRAWEPRLIAGRHSPRPDVLSLLNSP